MQIGVQAKDNRSEYKEQREARMAVLPFLQVNQLVSKQNFIQQYVSDCQAELDRKYSVELKEQYAKEAEIMKDVPGWEVGKDMYSKRWNHPIKKF